MTRKLASQAVEASLQKVVWRRKFKAFMITSTAICALACMFWSMSVPAFLSQVKIRLAIHSPDDVPTSELKDQFEQQWTKQLGDKELDQQIRMMSRTTASRDPLSSVKNYDRVRHSLGYELVPDSDNRHVDIYLNYQGRGTKAEQDLVSQLSEDIARRFAAIGAGLETDASLWVQQQLRLQDSQQQKLGRVKRLITQLDSDITRVRSFTEPLTQIDTGSIAQLPVANSDFNWEAQPAWSEAWHDEYRPRVSLLRQKLNALKEKQALLMDNPFVDSSADSIALEIQDLRLQLHELDSVRNAASNRGSMPAFQNISHRSQPGSLAGIKGAIDSIDVISIKSTFAELEQDFESQKQLTSEHWLANRDLSNEPAIPVLIESVSEACAKPLGGLPSGSAVLGCLLLSMLVGSVVAWGYSPLKEDRGFADLKEIETTLKLPVVSKLIRKSGDDTEEALPLCNLIMELARLALLVILLIVVFGLVFDSSVRETFAENPLYGFARIMWNLLGK